MSIIFTEGFVYTKGITTYMYLMLEKTMILNLFRNIWFLNQFQIMVYNAASPFMKVLWIDFKANYLTSFIIGKWPKVGRSLIEL